eukprot:3055870-Prymnesium_polylepis.1
MAAALQASMCAGRDSGCFVVPQNARRQRRALATATTFIVTEHLTAADLLSPPVVDLAQLAAQLPTAGEDPASLVSVVSLQDVTVALSLTAQGGQATADVYMQTVAATMAPRVASATGITTDAIH